MNKNEFDFINLTSLGSITTETRRPTASNREGVLDFSHIFLNESNNSSDNNSAQKAYTFEKNILPILVKYSSMTFSYMNMIEYLQTSEAALSRYVNDGLIIKFTADNGRKTYTVDPYHKNWPFVFNRRSNDQIKKIIELSNGLDDHSGNSDKKQFVITKKAGNNNTNNSSSAVSVATTDRAFVEIISLITPLAYSDPENKLSNIKEYIRSII
jgi:hypothetical protein